ncbi:MAG TPA: 30S ribosome-binding factor RbfA [Steroidobacteraceae bacterium]|nr:30S ribosome-binding factor RbfA [Steroidobacteraceae bacterium]
MPRDPHRSRRIEGELQRVVSELLRREVRDPRVGGVTITDVRVAPDLTSAKLFYARLDAQRSDAEVQAGLERVAGFLRGQVGRALKLRVAPELMFRPDEQLVAGMRLASLIDSAVAEDASRHVEDGSAAAEPAGSPDKD